MANPKPALLRRHWPIALCYAGTVALFLWICGHFYLPGKGFTYLVMFGGKVSARYLPELRALNHYEVQDFGYDAQYYAQIAMRPQLGDPELNAAVDSLPYRARRILFCWTAYGLALGNPVRALHIYAVQNIVCWLALAALMLRWFPAVNWGNFFRWAGVLFSFGLCFSVRGSLVDGPSLLLIAAGVALAEAGRPWWSAALLGVAGLGKETNLLAGAALAQPNAPGWRGWWVVLRRGLLVALPLALWLVCLRLWLGGDGGAGLRNFALPFAAYIEKWRATLAQFQAEGPGSVAQWSVLMLITLTAQGLFFALRPRWQEPWWRVGAAYTVLLIFLGDAVWEGYPAAASRVLLPMALAFNILVPRGRAWWVVLLLGNLTLIFSYDTLKAPGSVSSATTGPRSLVIEQVSGKNVEAVFNDRDWFSPERSRFEYWRWSRGSAEIVFHNPHATPLIVDIYFELKSSDERTVTVRSGEQVLWHGFSDRSLRGTTVAGIRLEPGNTSWRFDTDREAQFPNNVEPRKLAFSLRNLEIRIKRVAEPVPEN